MKSEPRSPCWKPIWRRWKTACRRLDAETIGTLRDQTRRLTRFSVDVNALSVAERRTTSIDARWTSPRLLISTASAAFAPSYHTKGVSLTESVAADLPEVWADPERLGQVLGNLLDNALRHTGPGGRVSVTATASADDEIAITVVRHRRRGGARTPGSAVRPLLPSRRRPRP